MKIHFPKISTWTHTIDEKRLARVILLLILALIVIFILLSYSEKDRYKVQKTFWLIDASLSMNTEEKVWNNTTTRMAMVKEGLMRIFASWSSGEHGIGLFAQDMRIVSPFTSDLNFLINGVKNIPLITYNGGTNILGSLEDTLRLLGWKNIHLIVITDGGDDVGYCRTQYCQWDALRWKTHITLVSVGSTKWGKIRTWQDLSGDPVYKSYGGKTVISIRNDSSLQSIAQIVGADRTIIDPSDEWKWEELILAPPSLPWALRFLLILLLTLILTVWLSYPILTAR